MNINFHVIIKVCKFKKLITLKKFPILKFLLSESNA